MATPRQWRRRRRFSLFALTVVGALVVAAVAFGAVTTSQSDYTPGSVVTISGDNSNGAGYLNGETVDVAVSGPNGYFASCSGVADESGAWSCPVTLVDSLDAVGSYSYTATGESSGVSESGMFTDSVPATTTTINLPANVTYGDSFTFNGTVTVTTGGSNVTSGNFALEENRNAALGCSPYNGGSTSDIYTQTISAGTWDSGALPPKTIDFTGSPALTAGNYFVQSGLSVGSYGFKAVYAGNPPTFANSDSTCKLLTVQKADTSVTGTPAPASITLGDSFDVGWTVSSTKGVTGNTATGTVTMSDQTPPVSGHFNCNAPSSRSVSAAQTTGSGFTQSGSGGSASTGFTCTPDTVGDYTFKMHFADTDGNYNNADSALVYTVHVLPESSFTAVTSKGLCTLNAGAENQFRLIYTPDQSLPGDYKLSASNPGQFSYNVAYSGSGDEDVALPSGLTDWFVTQGAMPVKIYDGGSVADGCIQPGNLIASETVTNGAVHVPALSGDFALITVHMDYKWKGEYQCVHGANDLATCGEPDDVTIISPKSYTGLGVTSVNVFKNDPGIGGLVTQASDQTPVAGAAVQIYDAKNKLLATVTTDQDGWYMWNYKYTGKPATFTVKLVDTGESTSVTLKANGFLVVNFTE